MKNRYVLLADLIVFGVAVFGAFGLRFDWFFATNRPEFVPYVIAAALIKPVVFYLFGMYGRFWRYATVDDVVALMIANSAASVAMAVFVSLGIFVFGFIFEFSRSVLFVDWVLAAGGVAAVRLSIRVIGESSQTGRRAPGQGKRVLIAGAGAAGAMVVREMQRNPGLGMEPVGFLDDDTVKIGKRIYGVPVLGALPQLHETVKARRIDGRRARSRCG